MTQVDCNSSRLSATTVPVTWPPITASCVTMSPLTTPSLPTTTAFPALTFPSTIPSIRMVPSVSQSPITFVPWAMMEIEAAVCVAAWSLAMPTLWLPYVLIRIDGLAAFSDFEVQMRRSRLTGIAAQRDHLQSLHFRSLTHQKTRGVAIHTLELASMIDHDVLPVNPVFARKLNGTGAGRPNIGILRY